MRTAFQHNTTVPTGCLKPFGFHCGNRNNSLHPCGNLIVQMPVVEYFAQALNFQFVTQQYLLPTHLRPAHPSEQKIGPESRVHTRSVGH
jgi:hypothetical protein